MSLCGVLWVGAGECRSAFPLRCILCVLWACGMGGWVVVVCGWVWGGTGG